MNKKNAFAGLLLLLVPTFGLAESLTVQIEKAPIRSTPSFLGKIITNVSHQGSVDVIEKKGAWRLVKFGSNQGWMHVSALVQSQLKLHAGEILDHSVSGEEVSLAGKGFNSDVEKAYRSQHGSLGYAWIDKMEKVEITGAELEQFASKSDFKVTTR
ncbi:MAG: SH3 domain-containing protein [Methylococcaceae bacterium]|nr:SH3 domain-containing protein [Methylococcaceae bacterium]